MVDSPIEVVLERLRSGPSRTWSIVVTLFGNAIVPRGGSLWLGSLLPIFEAMGVTPGVVRTAMSRLAADGWFQRQRVGRNSFYSLTDTGRAASIEAAGRICGPPQAWDGRFQLMLPGGDDRDAARLALERAGFGSVAPGVWIAPLPIPVPPGAAALLRLQSRADLAAGRQLAARAWKLGDIAGAYASFLEAFEPLRAALAQAGRWPCGNADRRDVM